MSRSLKRTPICGYSSAASEKQDKRRANRHFRRIIHRQLGYVLRTGDSEGENVVVSIREVSNIAVFAKDGKQFLHKPTPLDMRK